MNAMPKIAAYDSWNPISDTAIGSIVRCISKDTARMLLRLACLPVMRAVSFNAMNMKALVIEAPAPVAKV